MERASPAALAEFRETSSGTRYPLLGAKLCCCILDLVDGELHVIPIGTLILLPVPLFCVSYPADFESQIAHECCYCPQINYPGNIYPIHKFHLASAAESHLPSNVKLSSSSSVAKLQSSCHSLSPSSSTAKLQASSRYNYRSDDISNPHSPGLDKW
jgi:hypothetical protein